MSNGTYKECLNYIKEIVEEYVRVTAANSNIYVISYFKMDKVDIENLLIPLLLSKNTTYSLI